VKNKALRVLLLGISTLYLFFSMACSGSPNDKYLNNKYEKNSFESNTYRDGLTVSGTIDQVATQFIGKKGETYMFSLGFQPTTDNITEFEQVLRNDFDGEIEIFQEGKLHSIIKYNEFNSFTWSPGKDTYGPVYYLIIDDPRYTLNYSFMPKIRAKETCTYSFFLQRVRKSFSGYIAGFFKSKTNDGRKQYIAQNPKPEDDKINVPAVLRRIDMDIEKRGKYAIQIGIQSVNKDECNSHCLSLLGNLMKSNYDGNIKLYKNGNPYLIMRYEDSSGSGLGLPGKWNYHDIIKDGGSQYSFYVDKPGIYSFIPEMKSFEEFEFSLFIYHSFFRK